MEPFEALADIYALGKIIADPDAIIGGRSHKIWRIKTQKGDYAIKKLLVPKENNLRLSAIRNAEKLAIELSKSGYPALAAMDVTNDPIIAIHNEYYIVYPWLNAHSADPANLPLQQINLIGDALKRLHQYNDFGGILTQANYAAQDWDILLDRARQADLPYVKQLTQHLDTLILIDKKGLAGFERLTDKQVISHGDLDPFNVLWHTKDKYTIIDWELAQLAHPAIDYISTLLYWSLDGLHLSTERMQAFSQGYQSYQAYKGMMTDALYTVLGQWLTWFEYNLIRATETPDQALQTISINEAQKTLNTVVYLAPMITTLSKMIEAW